MGLDVAGMRAGRRSEDAMKVGAKALQVAESSEACARRSWRTCSFCGARRAHGDGKEAKEHADRLRRALVTLCAVWVGGRRFITDRNTRDTPAVRD